ncbi:achaete-scute family bHLH transcription factor 4 [Columba livia]|uniref:Achaete-scute family bHLH transcription factor 4 n=1 Tax=Columba livia TaxID=8932 RepID=A0A2I0MK82_COLLI|nr:achaete-scute homolog 4 [Columba livia]PKK30086.1 achaete-scute family bHLH transcription factor 4 [Columba livia]
MDSNKDDDGLLNRIAFPGAMSLANSHVHPHGLPLREPFGVPFRLDPSYWEQAYGRHAGRISYIPFPGCVGVYDYSFEPAFIRKRNERERQRVRCVNEGYTRLREHLPKEFADKRLSKVETLRAAISYIKHLQSLLDCHPFGSDSKEMLPAKELAAAPSPGPPRECNSDGESKTSSASSPYSEFEETGS